MITIRVKDKKFKGVYSWDDITLQQFCDLAAIPMPEGYEQHLIADGNFTIDKLDKFVAETSKITDEQLKKAFPAYFRKVISVLSNISQFEILEPEEVNEIYNYFFKPFVLSLVYNKPVIHFMGQVVPYEPKQAKMFRIVAHFFRLPKSVTIMDQEFPLFDEPVITYSEASDTLGGANITQGDIKRLSLFMAIYCRKWYERKYNQKRALKRQKLFMKAPMSVVWSVFFYTVRRLPDSGMIIQLFGKLPRQIQETVLAARAYRDSVTGG
jgi:hypothetical protein